MIEPGVVEVAELLVGTTARVLEETTCALRIVAVVVVAAAGVEVEKENREIGGRRDRKEVMVVGQEAVNSGRQPWRHVNETEEKQQAPGKALKSDERQPELWDVRQGKRAWREYGRGRTGAWASRHGGERA